jgi:tetratricopeptide (TPR) repeat protein
MRSASHFVLLLFAGSPLFAEVPKSIPEEWRPAFEAQPEMTEPGVYPVEIPQKALIVTGRFIPTEPLADNPRNRQISRERAELAAYSVLYSHYFEKDKDNLIVPNRFKSLANDALLKDAHRRTISVRGAKVLAVWTDPKGVCCTLLISADGVSVATEFEPSFRASAGSSQLKAYEADNKLTTIRTAFECDPNSPVIRKAYSNWMVKHGFKIAGFLLASPTAKLPNINEQLSGFLKDAGEADFKKAVALFEQSNPDLEAVLHTFLSALESQYANPDCLNYIGVCFRLLGYLESAHVFFVQAVAHGPHRLATTNLGLNLIRLGRAEEARAAFAEAIKIFPDEPWTVKAREAIKFLDEPKFKDVEIEKPYLEWLTCKPSLMADPGVKIFKLDREKFGLVVVATVQLKDGSAKDILRAERVTKEKALRDFVAKESGMTIASVQTLEEKTIVEVVDGKSKAKSVTEYMEWTQKHIEGVGKELPVIGHWKSEDGSVFYLAVGIVCFKDGSLAK